MKQYHNEKMLIDTSVRTRYFNGLSGYDTTSNRSVGWTNTKSGEGTPYYRKRIKECTSATSPFTGSLMKQVHRSDGFANFHAYNPTYRAEAHTYVTGCYAPGGFVSLTADSPVCASYELARDYAAARWCRKARGKLQSATLGEDVVELGKALSMIHRPASAIFDLLSGITNKLGRQKQAFLRRGATDALIKAASGSWLEFNFGWKNLHRSVVGGCQAYHDWFKLRQAYYIHASGTVEDMIAPFPDTYGPYGLGHIYMRSIRQRTDNSRVVYRGVVTRTKIGGALGQALELVGLHPIVDFVPTLWELFPFSWLIDYFTNINDIISCKVFPQNQIAWCQETGIKTRSVRIISTVDEAYTKSHATGLTNPSVSWQPSVLQYETRNITRTKVFSPPVPGFHFHNGLNTPWNDAIGRDRMFNIAALLGQLMIR